MNSPLMSNTLLSWQPFVPRSATSLQFMCSLSASILFISLRAIVTERELGSFCLKLTSHPTRAIPTLSRTYLFPRSQDVTVIIYIYLLYNERIQLRMYKLSFLSKIII